MSRPGRTALTTMVLLTALPGFLAPLKGQSVAVPEEPLCGDCRLFLEHETSIGHLADPVGFGPMAYVGRAMDGRFAVSSATFPGELALYDAAGEFVELVGRPGEGPGEMLGELIPRFGAGDSLHVLMKSGTRYTVFAPNMVLARTIELPGHALDACFTPDEELTVLAPALGANREVTHVHTVRSNGHVVARSEALPLEGWDGRATPGHVACDGDRVWVAATVMYRVSELRPDGGAGRILTADREWFPAPQAQGRAEGASAARLQPGAALVRPLAIGLSADSLGRLWSFVAVPGPDCCRGDEVGANDTIVEVLDPERGRVIVRARFDEVLRPLPGDRAYSLAEDEIGHRTIEVWRVTLIDP